MFLRYYLQQKVCLLWEKCLFGEKVLLMRSIDSRKECRLLIFPNSPLLQIRTFSLGQKGCAYYEKSAYYERENLIWNLQSYQLSLISSEYFFLKKRTICPLLVRIILEHVEIVYFCQSTGPKSHCDLVLYWRKWVVGANLCRAGLVLWRLINDFSLDSAHLKN